MENNQRRLDFETLYTLCNKNQWFTAGTCKQYDKLFERNRQGASLTELATIIWICSAPEFTLDGIYETLLNTAIAGTAF